MELRKALEATVGLPESNCALYITKRDGSLYPLLRAVGRSEVYTFQGATWTPTTHSYAEIVRSLLEQGSFEVSEYRLGTLDFAGSATLATKVGAVNAVKLKPIYAADRDLLHAGEHLTEAARMLPGARAFDKVIYEAIVDVRGALAHVVEEHLNREEGDETQV